ncbi:MAG: FAD-binding oxidoreductase [Actinomycetia bacterium]|nr:FAD-binding oxidoreductase [Actinomycetes bacterium]
MDITSAAMLPYWWDAVDTLPTRDGLAGDMSVDVAIIGAGFTGLWCAYHLTRIDPTLRIAVVEKDHVGFGASGRNGGWCHAEYPLGRDHLVQDHGHDAAMAHMRALFASVDEVGEIIRREGIDAEYEKGGVLTVARSDLQMTYAHDKVEEARSFGLSDDDVRLLDGEEARAMLNATDVVGGVWNAHGAAIHPAKLVHGLASVVETRGVSIYEGTVARGVGKGVVRTDMGRLTAPMIVVAMEGYRSQLPGEARRLVPLYSLMVATEPLPADVWDEIGLAGRQVFGDFRNLIIYGQRTGDGRLAFGGRGAPYHWGSAIKPGFDIDDDVHRELASVLTELFPQLDGYEITHRWGGPLGVSRDWRPSVTVDHGKGVAWAGGYVGDGVNTAHMAGQTLAELITRTETERTSLPWVNHRWPKWEPEPLRWIGINTGLALARAADRAEQRTGKHSRKADLGLWLRGRNPRRK